MVVRLPCKESVAGSTPAKGSKAFFDVLKIVAKKWLFPKWK